MKKILWMSMCAFAFIACNQHKAEIDAAKLQNDSLRSIIEARDNEINDMMGTLNELQEGFRAINDAENRITLAKSDEAGTSRTAKFKEEVTFITQRMAENRQLIEKLQQQLRETGFKGDQMRKTLAQLTAQLAQKDKELQKLKELLDAKDIHISKLDETINNLNSNVANLNVDKQKLTTEKEKLNQDNAQKTETINVQDKQLNTAWYVFGTKKELKEQHILDKNEVLRGSFNKDYFTKIDIRVTKEIKLYSKSAEILTSHPSSSYTLTRDVNKQYVLRISDPNTFWSTSKYLVIRVK